MPRRSSARAGGIAVQEIEDRTTRAHQQPVLERHRVVERKLQPARHKLQGRPALPVRTGRRRAFLSEDQAVAGPAALLEAAGSVVRLVAAGSVVRPAAEDSGAPADRAASGALAAAAAAVSSLAGCSLRSTTR